MAKRKHYMESAKQLAIITGKLDACGIKYEVYIYPHCDGVDLEYDDEKLENNTYRIYKSFED